MGFDIERALADLKQIRDEARDLRLQAIALKDTAQEKEDEADDLDAKAKHLAVILSEYAGVNAATEPDVLVYEAARSTRNDPEPEPDYKPKPPAPRVKVTPEKLARILSMRAEGHTVQQIADDVGVSQPTVYLHIQKERKKQEAMNGTEDADAHTDEPSLPMADGY